MDAAVCADAPPKQGDDPLLVYDELGAVRKMVLAKIRDQQTLIDYERNPHDWQREFAIDQMREIVRWLEYRQIEVAQQIKEETDGSGRPRPQPADEGAPRKRGRPVRDRSDLGD